MNRKKLSLYFAAASAGFAAAAPNLPDTTDRSPRSIAFALAAGLAAVAIVLRGSDSTPPVPPEVLPP